MRRLQTGSEFLIPELLVELLARGIWPADGKAAAVQDLRSIVPSERVRIFAAEEDRIYLESPPFRTISEVAAAGRCGDFWQRFGALQQIVPSKAVVIGDFGPGSDAPIILNYARNDSTPPVYRLRWGPETSTEWVQGAESFEEFAAILGLTGGVA